MLERFFESTESHQDKLLAGRNAAQVDLAEAMGVDLGVWIDMGYADIFSKVLEANPTIVEDLADPKTYKETVEELKAKVNH